MSNLAPTEVTSIGGAAAFFSLTTCYFATASQPVTLWVGSNHGAAVVRIEPTQ
jgi:hypothetical protein